MVGDGADLLNRLVKQVSAPVRWDLCMQTMSGLEVTGILELPPAGTLTGIAKRALKGVETFALKTPDQLDDARAFVQKHAGNPSDKEPAWRELVAPMSGTLNHGAQAGDTVAAGQSVATVRNDADELAVTAPHGGTVAEWLVDAGAPVSAGQPLVRLHPKAGG